MRAANGRPYSLLSQHRGEMALPPQPVGPEAEGVRQGGAAVGPLGVAGGEERRFCLFDDEFRISFQKSRHAALVLRGEGAGGVDQASAGLQHGGGAVQDVRLPPGAHGHRLRAPVLEGGVVLAKHALSGAGGVHQDSVEICGEALRQPGGVLVQHQGVGDPQPLDVGGQDGGPLGMDLIADQQTLPLHPARDLGGLAAGGGAEIQHPLPRPGIQQLGRGHRAGLLQVIGPGGVVRMQTGPSLRVVIEAGGTPGHGS